jgi:hypothetical protein
VGCGGEFPVPPAPYRSCDLRSPIAVARTRGQNVTIELTITMNRLAVSEGESNAPKSPVWVPHKRNGKQAPTAQPKAACTDR